MTLPTFIVIGAGRSGTTSLHHYLARHPQVYMSVHKSPNYFVSHVELPPWEGPTLRRMAEHWVSTLEEYEALFAGATDETAIGEASPVYLQARAAAPAIRETCPDVKLVAVLRQPVERAFAHYLGRRRDGLDSRPSFADAVAEELARGLPEEVAFGSYLGCGRYAHFLADYVELFGREHLRAYLFEDLVDDPSAVLADLFEFVGVDPEFVPDTSDRHGRTGDVRNPVLRFLWTRSAPVRTALRPHLPASVRDVARPLLGASLVRPELPPALRAELTDLFRDDVAKLETLIGRELSHWLDGRGGGHA